MTTTEIQEIDRIMQNYRNKKVELHQKIREIEEQRENEEITEWSKEIQIENLRYDIVDTKERKEYLKIYNRAQEDDEYEKYFRASHIKIYFGFIIDPKKL